MSPGPARASWWTEAALGVALACGIAGGGVARATPPDSPAARAPMRIAAPATIDSDASLEFFIATAARLAAGDSAKQLALLQSRLEALEEQKQALSRRLLDASRQLEASRDAALRAASGAEVDRLKVQLAKLDVDIADLLRQIQLAQDQERRAQDDMKRAEDALRALDAALAAAADRQRTATAVVSSTGAFARRLPADKRVETAKRVRAALAQLAEARMLRLTLSTPATALHSSPKPPAAK